MEDKFILYIEPHPSKEFYVAYVNRQGSHLGIEFSIWELYPNGINDLGDFGRETGFTIEQAREFGVRLFDTVIKDSIRDAFFPYFESRDFKEKRFWLNLTKAPELENIFWESLYFAKPFSYNHVTIFRYIDSPFPRECSRALTFKEKPLRILTVISSPADLPPIEGEGELSNLRNSLKLLEEQNLVQSDLLERPTFENFVGKLRQGQDNFPYHVLFFTGYHAFDRQDDTGRLFLEDDDGQTVGLTAKELSRILDECAVSLIVINTRSPENVSGFDSLAGIARQINQAGCSVIANFSGESGEFARRFAESLERKFIFGNKDFFESISRQHNTGWGAEKTYRCPPVLYLSPFTEALRVAPTLGGEMPDFNLKNMRSYSPEKSQKEFYFNLEGEGARGDAVEFETLFDLVFDYNFPPGHSAVIVTGDILKKARQESLILGLTVIPVGFSFVVDKPENSNSRIVEFKSGKILKKARFKFRAMSREAFSNISNNQNPENELVPIKTGFHIIFNVKGLTLEQFFLPIRLVDSIEFDIKTSNDYVPMRFNLDALSEFSEMADECKEKMRKSIDEILSGKEAIS